MQQKHLTLTTIKNGKTYEWITIVEDGIPVWVSKSSLKKQQFMEQLHLLFQEALADDDEPVIEITCQSGQRYQISYFEAASLYLCENLEGRYSTLSTMADAMWDLICEDDVTDYRLL